MSHQHQNARDPRMTAPSYSQRFPTTPQYPASPYLVPATPASPVEAFAAQANLATPASRKKEDLILDPETFQIKNCKHPEFVEAFYHYFKNFSPQLFTPAVHKNCVQVLKHVINQLKAKKDAYRTQRNQLHLDLRTMRNNESVAKDAVEAQIQDAIKKYKDDSDQLKIDYSNEQSAHKSRFDQLQKQFENERSGNSELQKTVKVLNSQISILNQRNRQVESEADSLRKENVKMQNTLEAMEKERCDTTQLMDEIAKLKEKNRELEYDGVQIRHELEQECSSKSEMQKSHETSEAALNGKIETLEKRVKELESDDKKVVNQSIDAVKTLAESCKGCVNTVCKFKKQRRDALIEATTEQISALREKPANETPTNENTEASPSACVSRPRRSTRTVVDYANLDSVGIMMDYLDLGDQSKLGRGKPSARGSARRSGGRGAKRNDNASDEQELAEDEDDAEYGQKSKKNANGERGAKRGRPRGSRTSAASTRTRKPPAKKSKTNDECEKEEDSESQAVAAEELI